MESSRKPLNSDREIRSLLLLRRNGWGGRLGGFFGLRRLISLQRRPRAGLARRHDRQRDGRDHKDDGAPGRGLSKDGGGTARPERGLAPLASKGGSDVPALRTLQQDNNNQEQTNEHMQNGYQNDHKIPATLSLDFARSDTWCGRGDLNPHAFRRHPLKMVCLPIPPLPPL